MAVSRERYFLFALIGAPLIGAGSFAVRQEGVRSTADTLALYAGLGLCLAQVMIWLRSLIRWIAALRASKATIKKARPAIGRQ